MKPRYLQLVGGPRDGARMVDIGPELRVPIQEVFNSSKVITVGPHLMPKVGRYTHGRVLLYEYGHIRKEDGKLEFIWIERDVYRWRGIE